MRVSYSIEDVLCRAALWGNKCILKEANERLTVFATLCVLRKEFHAQLTEIVSLQTQSGSYCSFSLTEQRDLDANPSGSFGKKTLLCRMTNKQNTCSYKLLNAFSSTHKR